MVFRVESRELYIFLDIYLFKVNNRNTRTMCEICSKLTIKTPIKSLLLTLNRFHSFLCCFYCWLWTSACQLGYLEKINFVKLCLTEDNIASNRKRKKERDAISSFRYGYSKTMVSILGGRPFGVYEPIFKT